MCRPAQCKQCGRTTWAGCGQHVDQVRRSVPAGQWCTCRERPTAKQATAKPSTAAATSVASPTRRRLFGRSGR